MPGVLRDVLLSFCPETVRRNLRPESTLRTLRAATWTGLLQFLLMGYLVLLDYIAFFAERARQLAPYVRGTSETVQSGTAILISLEFLIHPLSIVLLYLALEGFLRFVAGLVTSEIVPSLPVTAAFGLRHAIAHMRENRRQRLLPPDTIEMLPGERIRIASANPKPAWNSSITIAIAGTWYEVEGEERGAGQRRFVYILRRAPASKIMRGFEEYDAAALVSSGRDASVSPGPKP